MKKSILFFILALLGVNNFMSAQSPDWLWAKNDDSTALGGTAWDYGRSVATDAGGNVIVAGYFYSFNITFGTTTLTNAGNSDIFIAKYDANGNVLWAKSVGGVSEDNISSVSTDSNGNIIITGWSYSASLTFGTTILTNAGSSDIFIVKYDAGGNVLWARNSGGYGYDSGQGSCTDANGNVYVTGRFSSGHINFGAFTLTKQDGFDVFVVKYDASGNVIWAKSAGGFSDDCGYSISTDANGNVFLTGSFISQNIYFGTIFLTNSGLIGDSDVFIVKYDANGNELWATNANGANDEEGYSITCDAGGNAYITGYFKSAAITFGAATLNNAGIEDLFIVKYDPNGTVLWAKRAGGPSHDFGYSLTTDVTGNIFMAGYFGSPSITFGTTTLTNGGSYDCHLVKYNSGGNVLWAKNVSDSLDSYGYGVSTDLNGNALVTGSFGSSNISFGTTTLTNHGGLDIFIAKISPCTPNTSSQTISACNNFLSPSGNYNYTVSGIYQDTIPNSTGCDSVITINLTINPSPVISVTASGATTFCLGDSVVLSAQPGFINYQWYRRNNAIPGATSANYTAKSGGKYKCFAQNSALCSDTSNIITVRVPCIPIGPNQERTNLISGPESQEIQIYPNPATSTLLISFSEKIENGTISILDITGKIVRYIEGLNEQTLTVSVRDLAEGVYMVRLEMNGNTVVKKLIIVNE